MERLSTPRSCPGRMTRDGQPNWLGMRQSNWASGRRQSATKGGGEERDGTGATRGSGLDLGRDTRGVRQITSPCRTSSCATLLRKVADCPAGFSGAHAAALPVGLLHQIQHFTGGPDERRSLIGIL